MKTILFILVFTLNILMFPVAALAQTGDTINLYIQLLDQSASKDSVTCMTLQSAATGNIVQQILDSAFQAEFLNYPLEQFSVQTDNNSEQNTPILNISLYRGSKTQILYTDQNSAEVSVAAGAKRLNIALILDNTGHFKLYAVSEKAIKAFSSPASQIQSNANQVGMKFYFQDMWGTAGSGMALKMDTGDLHPSNLDGEIYLDAVSMGTHKLTASSKNGAKLAESFVTLGRQNGTGLSDSNPSNPIISAGSGQQVVYTLADVQNSLVKIRQVSAGPLAPGTRPELSAVSLQGCLIDSSLKPIPQIKLSMGDYSSTTDENGNFEINKLPVDQYQLVAKDTGGKKIGALTLLMQKDFNTAIKDVSLNSASLTVGPSATNLYLTLQLTGANDLILKEASDKQLSVPPPSATVAAIAQAVPSNTPAATGNSLLAVYAYLLVAILALIVVVAVVLIRLRRSNKPKH